MIPHLRARLPMICAAVLLTAGTAARAESRIVDSVDVVRTPGHIDVALLFNCQVRYVTHTPAGEGEELRVRVSLAPDCDAGAARAESVQAPSDREIVGSIELIPLLANDIDVAVRWMRTERFVLLPTGDQRGLRIRLLRPGREAASSRVVISEPAGDLTTAYEINLESPREPFAADAVQEAGKRLGLPAYVSQIDIDGVRWHRQ